MPALRGFRVEEELHASDRATVHRATRLEDGRPVIVKALRQEYPTPRDVAAFRKEYEIVQQLAERGVEGVTRPVSFRGDGKDVAMLLDYLPGVSLREHIPAHGLPLSDALDLAVRLARALGAVHDAGFVHRDVKPGNVVVDPLSGESWLIDFGIASALERVVVAVSRAEGSIAYMSPEQTGRMNRPVDHRTDFYSLGVTLYEAISGRRPFDMDDPLALVHAHIALEPTPLHRQRPDVPPALSRVVQRLLAKTGEARYQSAAGLLADLEALRAALATGGMPDDFEPGRADVPARFRLPVRLYGRERELATLLDGFERAAAGRSELLMISGYSGVGKSALIHEVHKPIVRRRGYFIAGKFDQFKRNIPYASMLQAFGDLVRLLLTEPAARVARWRALLLEALGGIVGVATEVLPELALIVGPQPPPPELSGEAAQNRLNRAFVELVKVFARAEHPLVLFLDDLQWADRPTLNLLRLLVTEDAIGHLMVIGCYRDNEVDAHHPLTLALRAVAQQRAESGLAPVARVQLEGLGPAVLGELVADCLRAAPAQAAPLAALLHRKTLGNPFFVNQFLQTLHDDGLLQQRDGRWTFDLAEIEARAITDNVVELMTRKIRDLPEATQATLRVAAAVGNAFELSTLAASLERAPGATADDLWAALAAGLVVPLDDNWRLVGGGSANGSPSIDAAYRFLHDRVQQAAYAMIPVAARATTHLRIGRALHAALDADALEERLFTVVDQLKHGLDEIEAGRRIDRARLFARAGEKARSASAHEPAIEYLDAAQRLLGDDLWGEHYAVGFPVVFRRSECEYLLGHFDVAEGLFDELVGNAWTDLEKARVYRLKLSLYQSRGLFLETVDIAYRGLAHLGVELPRDPTQLTFLRELARFKWQMRGRSEADLKALPECTDPVVVTALDIMNDFSGPAFFVDLNIYLCVVLKMCSLSLEHGNAAESAYCWTLYGMMNGPIMGNIPHGMELGRVGEDIDRRHAKATLIPKVALSLGGLVYQWGQHPRRSLPYFERGFQAALESGDPTHAGYCANFMVCMYSVIGESLPAIEEATSRFWSFARKNRIEVQSEIQIVERQMARALMGRTDGSDTWDDADFDEAAWLESARDFQSRQPLHNYLIEKQATLYLLGHPEAALTRGDEAATLLDVSLGIPIFSNFHLFYGLANAACSDRPGARRKLRKMVRQHRKWARHNPDGFAHKRALLEAELARVRGQGDRAEALYEKAITQAGQQGFVHHEAIAHERAARHFLARGRERLGRVSLRAARHAYQRWGADAVVARLDAEFPDLGAPGVGATAPPDPTHTTTATRHGVALDLDTLLRASQIISREIVLADLLEKLTRLLLENAGARRVVLVLRDARGVERVQAEQVAGAEPAVLQGQPIDARADLCHGALNLASRTREPVVIDDVRAPGSLERDPYLAGDRSGSLACAPVLHGGEVMGLVHLENELATGAFDPSRLELLRLLSAQIGISIENAEHYRRAEQTARAFARFVPRQFLNFLGRDELSEVALGDAVQADMTVLFADIRGFTALSEQMSPSENMAFLNEYLQRVSPVMRTHGGFIDKYIGDAVMALFPGDPDDAVRAAIAMHHEVDRLNERRRARGDEAIEIGVGLHRGTLMLGTIGEPERMDSTVISDAVNTSARLEGMTKTYGAPILISGPTLAACRDAGAFRTRYLGEVRPRGRAAAVALHEIYDPLPPVVVERRDATRERVEAAARALHAGDHAAGLDVLAALQALDPDDRAVTTLLDRARAVSGHSGGGV